MHIEILHIYFLKKVTSYSMLEIVPEKSRGFSLIEQHKKHLVRAQPYLEK